MKSFLLKLLGFDLSRVPDDARTEWMLANQQHSWRAIVMVVVVAALVWVVARLYRRESETCPGWARWTLTGLRASVLLVLALIFLDPALVASQRRAIQPYVVLLLDESQSMSIPDRYLEDSAVGPVAAATGRSADEIRRESPTRAALVGELLHKDDDAFLRDLAQRGAVRVLAFSNKTNQIDTQRALVAPSVEGAKPATPTQTAPAESATTSFALPPIKPTGQGTLTAKAIRDALKSAAGSPLAAIVIISDGQDTARSDDPIAAAETAAAQATPIFTVGVGDPSKPRNVRVASVYADEQVWQGDPFEIQATLESQGLDEAQVEVELVEQPVSADGAPTGASTIVDHPTVKLPADGGSLNVIFTRRPNSQGQFTYTVQIAPQTGELLDTDNAKSVKVRVLKEQARVLLIAAEPTWDYRLVQGLLVRDPTMNLSCWLQSMDLDMPQEGRTVIDRLPSMFEQLNKYDLVMMFDPDPAEFNEAWCEALKKSVGENASGFLYVAGPKYSHRFLTDPKLRPLRDLLPVKAGESSAVEIDALTAKNNRSWPLAVVPSALDHPILRFDTDLEKNRGRWERMPGVYWSFPVQEVKPGARALIEHSDVSLRQSHGSRPLLVTGQYGAGRAAYLGFNGTWRWRQVGKDTEYFNKFWIQLSRYLVEGKLLSSKRRGVIETGGDRFFVGDSITITARLFDPTFQPLAQGTVKATLKSAGGGEQPVELKAITGQPGQFEGAAIATQLGLNELTIELTGDTAQDHVRVVKQFEVELPRVEFEDTRLNKKLLVDIAERSGGKYFEIDTLGDLAAAIPNRVESITVAGKPMELWDSSRMLLLLVGLLTAEWTLRKRFKLL